MAPNACRLLTCQRMTRVSYDSEHYVCHIAGYYPWSHNNTKPWYRLCGVECRCLLTTDYYLQNDTMLVASDADARYYFMDNKSISIYFRNKLTSINVRIKIVWSNATKGFVRSLLPKKELCRRKSAAAVDTTRFHANRTEWCENYRKMNTRCNSTCKIKINARPRPETIVNHNGELRCTIRETRLVLQDHEWRFAIL